MKLDLCIPGLLAAPSRIATELHLPSAPALVEWCARARTLPAPAGRYGFHCSVLATQQPPVAALAWLGATGERARGYTLLATPVHLKAGMHDLVLFSGPSLEVTAEECERLAQDITAFLGDEPGLECRGGQMFLRFTRAPDLQTTPLHAVQGMAVRERMPRGADATGMHGLMNEWQMFLHDHPVNRERTARGLPPLNGIWPWGEGELPPVTPRDVAVFARTLPLRGLGVLLGSAREPLALHRMLPAEGHCVIEADACIAALDRDDIVGWANAVQAVSAELLQPVLDWLAAHRNAEAILHAGDGTARALRGGRENRLRRAFRRPAAMRVTEE